MPKTIKEEGFLNHVFIKNKRILLITFIIQVLYLCVYKYCIPMPDFFSDSHSYVLAANRNLPLYYRPLGYSDFLSFLHVFSSSDLFVIVVQYSLLSFSTIFLLFSIDYLYEFQNRKIKILAFILTALNPIFLVLANQIASDSLFSFYTILWFSSLLWILKEGKWWALILQVIILYLAFKVRYQALFFPAISLIIFVLSSKSKLYYKIIGIFFSFVFISYAHKQEKKIVQKQVQADVFAGFSGWMMANNALLIYKYTNTQTNDFEDPDLAQLDKIVKVTIDSFLLNKKMNLKNIH